MAKTRNEVVEALKQGALQAKAQYVSIRREDLLLALGVDERRDAPTSPGGPGGEPRSTDKP